MERVRSTQRPPVPSSAPDVGLLVAAATAPGTFTPSLSARTALDQGLVTGLATGLQYLLTVSARDTLQAANRFLAGAAPPSPGHNAGRAFGVDLAAVPLGLAVARSLPPRAGEPVLRGLARQAAWRLGVSGLGGVLLDAAQQGTVALDDRLGRGGRLARVPVAVPVGLGVAYALDRVRTRPDDHVPRSEFVAPSAVRSLAVATGIVAGLTAASRGERRAAERIGRRLAAALPGPPPLWQLVANGAALAALGLGVSVLWHRGMQRIEAGTSAAAPVLESGEATRWVPDTVSGGPTSLIPWDSLGREGRRHALAGVRARPLPSRPVGLPDLSIETVMGEPARTEPVQVYVGLDSAATARQRVELALAELERTGAFDRSLLVLISPTGTGYVNYVAVAAVQYLTLGDIATVTLQYSKRPSPLSLGLVKAAREQNRLLWLHVLERIRSRPGRRPRVVLFGESLGALTSQDVFLHWGTLGLDALGIDRALWIGTPYGSTWRKQVTGADRLDVDRDAFAVVNDLAQLTELASRRGASPRYVLLSHDNDGVTRFGLDLLWTPPDWLAGNRPPPHREDGGSPRGIPPAMRWRPITTFFQSLVDMKNAQAPGDYRAWAHDYRADLPCFLSEVYGLPADRHRLAAIAAAVQQREALRERVFAGATPTGG